MAGFDFDQFVVNLSKDIVKELAPEEMPLFKMHENCYLKNPEESMIKRKNQDEMLGFGFGEAAIFLSPIAIELVKAALSFVCDIGKDIAKDEVKGVFAKKVKPFFKKSRGAKDGQTRELPATLKKEDLTMLHQYILETARQLCVQEDKAGLMADSIVGKFAVSIA